MATQHRSLAVLAGCDSRQPGCTLAGNQQKHCSLGGPARIYVLSKLMIMMYVPPSSLVGSPSIGCPQDYVGRFRLKTEPRAMVFMHDILPGGGGLWVIPGSHKREVRAVALDAQARFLIEGLPANLTNCVDHTSILDSSATLLGRQVEWAPEGGRLTFYGNTRFEDISAAARSLFVEVTTQRLQFHVLVMTQTGTKFWIVELVVVMAAVVIAVAVMIRRFNRPSFRHLMKLSHPTTANMTVCPLTAVFPQVTGSAGTVLLFNDDVRARLNILDPRDACLSEPAEQTF